MSLGMSWHSNDPQTPKIDIFYCFSVIYHDYSVSTDHTKDVPLASALEISQNRIYLYSVLMNYILSYQQLDMYSTGLLTKQQMKTKKYPLVNHQNETINSLRITGYCD